MADAPLMVILQMVTLLIENTFSTLFSMLGLSGDLLSSLSLVASGGGLLGLIVAFVVILVAGFFLVKLFFGSAKTIAMLVFVGALILAFIVFGLSVF